MANTWGYQQKGTKQGSGVKIAKGTSPAPKSGGCSSCGKKSK